MNFLHFFFFNTYKTKYEEHENIEITHVWVLHIKTYCNEINYVKNPTF